MVFQEDEQERTHEFVLRWSPDGGQSYRETARQQYNFSPRGTTQELEDYTVELQGVDDTGTDDHSGHKRGIYARVRRTVTPRLIAHGAPIDLLLCIAVRFWLVAGGGFA